MYLVFIATMSFAPNELVWYNKDGQTHSAGFSIDSLLAKSGMKPLTTLNEPLQVGGSSVTGQFSDLFRYMGVPVGLSTVLSDDIQISSSSTEDGGVVSESLFDKLLELAGPSESNKVMSTGQTGGKNEKTKKRKTKKVSSKAAKGEDMKKKRRQTRRK